MLKMLKYYNLKTNNISDNIKKNTRAVFCHFGCKLYTDVNCILYHIKYISK